MKFVKRTHGGNLFEQMMGRGEKQKWSSDKIVAKKRQKLARNEARLAGSVITEWKTENRKQNPSSWEIRRKMFTEIKLVE